MPKRVDYLGKKFRMLTVIARAPNTKQGATAWWCMCDCGKGGVYARSTDLRRGDVGSCGCATGRFITEANTKHGLSRTRVYKVWRAMLDRCYNPGMPNYHNYGGRGVRVVKRWHTFEHFYADMGDRPTGMSLERKHNSRWYSPGNCLWATAITQQNNRRNNRKIIFKGRSKTLAEWARQYGHPPLRLWHRLNRGWPVSKAITAPSMRQKKVNKTKEK